MNTRPFRAAIIFAAVVAIAIAISHWRKGRSRIEPAVDRRAAAAAPASAQQQGAPAATPAAAKSATEPVALSEVNRAEVAATTRMIAAHASLRSPEVADPDSAMNKRILQTMVQKALAQPAAANPTPAPKS